MSLRSISKLLIIGVLLALLGACSAVRLGYNNGPQLVWWWLDSYLDLNSEQTPATKLAIDRWFEWHRATQLPEYAALLATMQSQVLQPTTAAATCRWNQRLREAIDPAIDRAMVQAADLLPGWGERQWRHIEQRYAKGNDEMRSEYLQADPAERLKQSIKRTLTRAEQIYGRLDEAQRSVIAAGVAASPFDPQAWLAERQLRQRDTLATLRRLAAERADRDQRVAALRMLAERTQRSRQTDYRAYQLRLTDYNCDFAARIHNSTTPEQRRKARETLAGWEEDLRALAVPTPG